MFSLHWFRHWDKIFWVLFVLMGISVALGGFLSLISFEFSVVLAFFIVIIGAGKLANEISGQRMVNYQDDIYRKLHQLSQHLETTFNLTDSYRTKTEFRLGKLDMRRKQTEMKIENSYRDFAKKLIEMENRLNRVSKLMAERERRRFEVKEAGFAEKALSLIKRIPRGRVTTYSEIAKTIGSPKASKAIGKIIASNSHLKSVPFHRVVKSNGKIGGSKAATRNRSSLLKKEGIKVEKGRVSLDRHGFEFVPRI